MPVPKNSFACAICQKTFNNPAILIKHVEFRHSTEEQTPKSKIGSLSKEKNRIIITSNSDPLEICDGNSVKPFEFVPVQEIVEKCPVMDEGVKNLNEILSHDKVPGNVKIEDFDFEKSSLQTEKRINGNATKALSYRLKEATVAQNKAIGGFQLEFVSISQVKIT